MDNSSYSFHQVVLKLGGQSDHELVWRILFRGYRTPNFDRIIMLLNNFSELTLFLDNSSYSFHLIELKHSGQLEYEYMQRILFQGNSTPNFDRVIAL